jgi:hypothetical protein
MRITLSIVFLLLVGCVPAWASPCSLTAVPDTIQASLKNDFSGWKMVVPNLLASWDRDTWLEDYTKECPGMIKGKFTDASDDYVFNLLKFTGKETLEQIVYFHNDGPSYTPLIILKPSKVDVISVLRLFKPGRYKDVNTGKSIMIATDTIGLSDIGAGTIVYYWDGKRFRSIITSE